MNIFSSASKRALSIMTTMSDGQGLYSDGVNTAKLINVLLDRETEFTDEDGAVYFETTVTMESMDTAIGATITIDGRAWEIGRTVSDDKVIKVVIVQ